MPSGRIGILILFCLVVMQANLFFAAKQMERIATPLPHQDQVPTDNQEIPAFPEGEEVKWEGSELVRETVALIPHLSSCIAFLGESWRTRVFSFRTSTRERLNTLQRYHI